MRAPSTLLKRVITVTLAVLILANSYLAPKRAHAEIATAAVIGTSIVAAATAGVVYTSYTAWRDANGLTDKQAKGAIALAQLIYAANGGTNPALAQSLSNFTAPQTIINGFKNAGASAWANFNAACDTMRSMFGETWFDFSHLSDFYVSGLTAHSSLVNFRGGTVTYAIYNEDTLKTAKNLIGSATWSYHGLSAGDAFSGALGDTLISYDNGTVQVKISGYYVPTATAWSTTGWIANNGALQLGIPGASAWDFSFEIPQTLTFSNTLHIKAGEYVDTTNPDMQPKKVVIPPVWFTTGQTPDTTTSDDHTTGSTATTNPDTGVSTIEDGLASIYGALKNIGATISNAVMPIVNALSEFFRPYLDDITGELQGLSDSLETFPTSINKVISNIETLPSSIADALNLETIPQTLSDIKDNILTFPQTVANSIQNALETFPQSLENVKSTIIEKGDLIAGGISALGDYLSGIGTVISNAITGAAGATWDFLSDVVGTISTTLTNILDWTTTAVHDITLSIEGVLTDVFVPTISIDAETTQVKDIMVTKFPFGVPSWFKIDEKSQTGSLSSMLTFYNGQYGVLSRDFDLLAYKSYYASQISAIWTAFVYGLGVVALYKMLKPKVTV